MPKDGSISPQRNDPRQGPCCVGTLPDLAPAAQDVAVPPDDRAPGARTVRMHGLDGPDQMVPLRLSVLAALQQPGGLDLELDCGEGLEAAAAQFICATHKAAAALGRSVRFRGLDTPQAHASLALMGLRAAPDCALAPCPLWPQENIP